MKEKEARTLAKSLSEHIAAAYRRTGVTTSTVNLTTAMIFEAMRQYQPEGDQFWLADDPERQMYGLQDAFEDGDDTLFCPIEIMVSYSLPNMWIVGEPERKDGDDPDYYTVKVHEFATKKDAEAWIAANEPPKIAS